MKRWRTKAIVPLLCSTLLAASALSIPAFAEGADPTVATDVVQNTQANISGQENSDSTVKPAKEPSTSQPMEEGTDSKTDTESTNDAEAPSANSPLLGNATPTSNPQIGAAPTSPQANTAPSVQYYAHVSDQGWDSFPSKDGATA
mgnify:FL=1